MNFSNTFARLKEIIDEIFNKEFQIKYPNLYELTINNNRYTLLLRFLFGIEFFEMDAILARKYFRSNRYFMDSLGIDLLPEIKEVVDFENNMEINGESIRIIIKNILNKIKDEKCSELNLLTDYQKNLLNDNGYIVINNLIPHDVCDALNEKALWIAKNELENNCAYIYGSGNMQRVYNLIAKDNLFGDLIQDRTCHAVMEYMFQRDTFHDKYYLTSFHANILMQNAESQIWHIDANVPEPIPSWIIRSNSNFITEDYYADNGATEVIPGSHKFFAKPNLSQIDSNKFNSKFIEAPKGSIAFWHGHLWHRSGLNKTTKPRVALLGAYSASFFREVCMEENPYLSLNQNQINNLSTRLKTILGWNHGLKY